MASTCTKGGNPGLGQRTGVWGPLTFPTITQHRVLLTPAASVEWPEDKWPGGLLSGDLGFQAFPMGIVAAAVPWCLGDSRGSRPLSFQETHASSSLSLLAQGFCMSSFSK